MNVVMSYNVVLGVKGLCGKYDCARDFSEVG